MKNNYLNYAINNNKLSNSQLKSENNKSNITINFDNKISKITEYNSNYLKNDCLTDKINYKPNYIHSNKTGEYNTIYRDNFCLKNN